MGKEEPQVLQEVVHMAHCGYIGGYNAVRRHTLQRPEKGIKKPTQMAREKALWISDATWRLVDERTALRRTHMADHQELMTAMRRFQAALQEDMRFRVSKLGEDIEKIVESDQTRE